MPEKEMTVKPTFPEILFEDDSIIVLNKPAGLLSIPDREQTSLSLKDMLLAKYGSIFTVHQLDKDTSGIILFARTEAAHKYYSRLFEERKIEKYYLRACTRLTGPSKGTMNEPINEHPVQKGLMVVHRKANPR